LRIVHLALAGALALSPLAPLPLISPAGAQQRAPESFAPLARELLPAVVNISTSKNVAPRAGRPNAPEMPQLPPGSPFEEFFRDFFNRNRPPGQGEGPQQRPRRAQSLGSGFIIDAQEGIVVTNNHVIDGADEINVILQDKTSIRAELVGTDPRTDIAVLRIKHDKPLSAVAFGDSDQSEVGDWVIAIGNPFGFGGTVTAGIVSARGARYWPGAV
jgi:serine protease Do